MNKHHGQIIEFTLRKNDYNISDLAKSLNINRRTLYNWFNQERIKKEIVFRIGCIIRHDFSSQFPEMFSSEDFNVINKPSATMASKDEDIWWRDKYIRLLHEYNKRLDQISKLSI